MDVRQSIVQLEEVLPKSHDILPALGWIDSLEEIL